MSSQKIQFIFSSIGTPDPVRVLSSYQPDRPNFEDNIRWNNSPTIIFTLQINEGYLIENSTLQIILGSMMSQQIKLEHNRDDWDDLIDQELIGQLRERYLTMEDSIREEFSNFYQMVPGTMLLHYYLVFYMGIGATLAILAMLSYPQEVLGNPFSPLNPSFPLIQAEPGALTQELGSYLQLIGKGLTSLPLKTLGVNLFNLSTTFFAHYLIHLPNSQTPFNNDMAMLETVTGVSNYYTQESFKLAEQLNQFRKELTLLENAYQAQYSRLEKSSDQILKIRNKHQLSAITTSAAIGTASCQAIMNIRDKTLNGIQDRREELLELLYREGSGQVDRIRETGRNELEIFRGQLGFFQKEYHQMNQQGETLLENLENSVKQILEQARNGTLDQQKVILDQLTGEFGKLEERNKQQLIKCQQRWAQILQEMEQISEELRNQYLDNLKQDAMLIKTDLLNSQKTTLQVIQNYKEKSQLNITEELKELKRWIEQQKLEWSKFASDLENRLSNHLIQLNQMIEGRVERLIDEIVERINSQLEEVIKKRVREAQEDFNKTIEEMIIKRMEQSLAGKMGELDRKLRYAEKMVGELELKQEQQLLVSSTVNRGINQDNRSVNPNNSEVIHQVDKLVEFEEAPIGSRDFTGMSSQSLTFIPKSPRAKLVQKPEDEVEYGEIFQPIVAKIERVNDFPVNINPLSNLSSITDHYIESNNSSNVRDPVEKSIELFKEQIEKGEEEKKEGYLSDTQYGVGIDDQIKEKQLFSINGSVTTNKKTFKSINNSKPIANKVSYRPGQVYQIKQVT